MKSTNINRNVVAGKIASTISPAELSVAVSERRRDLLVDLAAINSNQADSVLAALDNSETLCDLETVELIDCPRIELLDGDQYKDSLSLSTGQKCTAILPILLLDSPNPLIIDQPEDNLDNSFIYNTVVKTIGEMKLRRQMIFVTHNPNVPVLGDAERVFVLKSDGRNARVRAGTVDECKDDIITLLEGGAEAFQKRQRRYNY